MKIGEIMTSSPATLCPSSNLAQAAEIFWTRNCGIVPVVDEKNRLVGVLTDRDVCIALGTRDARASSIRVDEAMSKKPVTCSPDDDVKHALAAMHTNKVRRLAIVGKDGKLRGVLSLGDVIRQASTANEPTYASVMNVLKRFYEPATEELATAVR